MKPNQDHFLFKTEMNEDKNEFDRDMFTEYTLFFRLTSNDFVLISLYHFLRHSNCVKLDSS